MAQIGYAGAKGTMSRENPEVANLVSGSLYIENVSFSFLFLCYCERVKQR
jgi:hypothetical protein